MAGFKQSRPSLRWGLIDAFFKKAWQKSRLQTEPPQTAQLFPPACKQNARSLHAPGVRGRSPCQGRQPARLAGSNSRAPLLRCIMGDLAPCLRHSCGHIHSMLPYLLLAKRDLTSYCLAKKCWRLIDAFFKKLGKNPACKLNLRRLLNRGYGGEAPVKGDSPSEPSQTEPRRLPARLQTEPPQSAHPGVRGRSPCKGRQPVRAEPN